MFMGNEKNLVPFTPGIMSLTDGKIVILPRIVIIAAFLPGVSRRN
jgi:hypothetical protein